jgi:hypothetical protein
MLEHWGNHTRANIQRPSRSNEDSDLFFLKQRGKCP